MRRNLGTIIGVLLTALGLAITPAQALPTSPTSWLCPTNNSPASCAQATAGLELTVSETAPGSGLIAFSFAYSGDQGSVVQIYIQDLLKTLFAGPPQLSTGTGASFSSGATPPTPPGVNPFTVAYSASSNAAGGGVVQNGLQRNDDPVRLIFTLNPGMTTAVVDTQLVSGDLGAAVHVVSLEGGNSEALRAVFSPPSCPNGGVPPLCVPQDTNVPEPRSLALLGIALAGMTVMRRRRTT